MQASHWRTPTRKAAWTVCAVTVTLATMGVPGVVRAQETKSEGTASLLSLTGTLLPIGLGVAMAASDDQSGAGTLLIGTGLYLGPAAGYWYGGASGRGWKGVGIRFGITGAAILAIGGICSGDNCNIFGDDGGALGAAMIVALGASVAIVGSAIYDIANVHRHVRNYNQELRRRRARLSLAPIASPAHGGTFGVVGQVRF